MVGWTPIEKYGVAIYSFAASGSQQLSLTLGELVRVEEECQGWYRGCTLQAENKRGVFPASYIRLKADSESTTTSDWALNEITQVLGEWLLLMKKQFRDRQLVEYRALKDRITLLLDWYHKIMSPSTTETRRKELKDKAIAKIEEGRRLMGLDLIVRTTSGEQATEKNTGIIGLYQLHKEVSIHSKDDDVDASDTKAKQQKGINTSNTASPTSTRAGQPLDNSSLYHILLDLKIFMCSVGEQTELYFSIYNKTIEKFITEEFRVVLTDKGMPYDVSMIGKLKSIFIDISTRDSGNNLYLICRMIRKGKLVYESKKDKKNQIETRRPFGCAALCLDDQLWAKILLGKEIEFTMAPIYSALQESQFATLHDAIIKKNFQGAQEVPRAKGLVIGLTGYSGDFNKVLQDNQSLKEIAVTNRFGFPEVILPGINRNDFYVTLDEGEFSQERKTSAKNVEVTAQVLKDNGEPIKDCIFLGTGDKPKSEYRSFVLYHSNTPHWGETFRVSIPAQPEQAHLYLNIRHCSSSDTKEKSGFSSAFLKLTNPDGTIVPDKIHTLDTFKRSKTNEKDPVFYLKESASKLAPAKKGEQLKVRTTLVSTKLTQNGSMASLLKWRSYTGNLVEVLNQFKYVDQLEIIKFLQETFDAMFAILDSKTQGVAIPVYNAIVSTIALLVDEKKKYTNFRPVLDTYIEKQFSSIMAHKHLMSCLKHYFDEIEQNPAQISKIIPTLKTLEYIFKLITASRILFNKKQTDKEDVWFKKDLLDVLAGFNQLMKKTSPEFIGAQTLALKNFSSMFQDLGQIFDIKELSGIAARFIESVQYGENLKLMNMEKLLLIHKLVCSDYFLNPDARSLLMPVFLQQIRKHITSSTQDEVVQCTKILSVMLDLMQTKIQKPTVDGVSELLCLIPELIMAIQGLRISALPGSDTRLDVITCLLSIFYLTQPAHFAKYINDMKDNYAKTAFLLTIAKLLKEFLSTRTFPENWFAMCMFQYFTEKKILTILSPLIQTYVTSLKPDSNSQEFQLFSEFFQVCISYIKQNALALENFTDSKQALIKESYGDMRLEVTEILKSLWTSLGKHQSLFISQVIGPFLELMLVRQQDIKHLAVNLYGSLLEREYTEFKAFTIVETQTIDTLDKISNEGLANEEFKDLFIKSLEARFQGQDDMSKKGRTFLNDINELLTLLIALRRLPEGEAYEDDRTIATMKLMEYLKQTGRKETYTKYVHMLCDQHLSSNNYTEAGFTLLLHAELLQWSEEMLEEQGDFPAETSRQRKERLLRMAIDYLDKGKMWEKAIELMRDLRVQYETIIFDYQKLADILQLESSMFRKITSTERFFSTYFRVGYYGKGFDSSIAGKEYIYRGFELERISDFNARMMSKFPNAQLLTYTEPPPAEIINGDGQYLQIYNVKPASKDEMEGKEKKVNKKMPPSVVKYQSENNVNVFLYSRPFRKTKKSTNEFRDLWISNCYYVTEDTFPTVHRRSEITQKSEVMVSPIDNAINTIQEKNKELVQIITKHESGKENISPFTMVLKGVIDAAVNGGVNMYKEAFFSPDYVQENPDKRPSVVKLREALTEQLDILEKGLAIHAKICPEDFGALQEQLESQFASMKASSAQLG